MRHNHVSGKPDASDASHWAVGLSLPVPHLGWAGGILVQVQGPEARQCRVALGVAEAGELEAALREATSAPGAVFRREASLPGTGFTGVERQRGQQEWSVRTVAVGDVAIALRNQWGDHDEVTMPLADALDFADALAAMGIKLGSEAATTVAAPAR